MGHFFCATWYIVCIPNRFVVLYNIFAMPAFAMTLRSAIDCSSVTWANPRVFKSSTQIIDYITRYGSFFVNLWYCWIPFRAKHVMSTAHGPESRRKYTVTTDNMDSKVSKGTSPTPAGASAVVLDHQTPSKVNNFVIVHSDASP